MSTVTLTYDGKTAIVPRASVESQLVKATAAIQRLRETMEARHAAQKSKPFTRDRGQADADQATMADIARYEAIIEACHVALAGQ